MIRIALFAALALVFGPSGPAEAQTKAVPGSQADVTYSFAPIVRQAAPAVVNVYTSRVVRRQNYPPFFDDPFFRRFFGDPNSGKRNDQVQNALGSGVIVDPSGLVVTNAHVIEGADEIKVALTDRREFVAEVVLSDERTDLAVLRINEEGPFPALEFDDSDSLEVGDIVLARRDMGTSYHLSVVIDDAHQDVTHVTRGEDLFEATATHVLLQRLLDLPTPVYHHHRLIRDADGKRLAKRDDARAIATFRAEGATPADIRRMVGL